MITPICIAAAFLLAFGAAAIADRMCWARLPAGEGRIGCIDGLRGYLALGVMIHHFVIWLDVLQGGSWGAPASRVFQNFGQGAVALFFMVTGALFYHKIAPGFSAVNWRALYISRVFRLVPLFWLAFLVVNLIIAVRHGLDVATHDYAAAAARWLLFIALPPLSGADAGRVVAYAPWTLTYEWICYLTLPLVALALGVARRPAQRLALLAALVLLCALGVWALRLPNIVEVSLRFLVPFLLGMIALELTRRESVRALLLTPWAALIGIAALVTEVIAFPTSFAFLPCLVLALFFLPAVAGNSYFGLLAARPSIVLGEASYGIYLLHGIVLYLALIDARPLADAYGLTPFWIALPVLAAIVVAVSILLHEIVEKPAIRLGRSLARGPFAQHASTQSV